MPKLGMEPIRTKQVVEATKRCLVEKGFSNLSVKDIASAAGVSTGIIYHYFENKEDILLKVLKQAFRKSYEQVLETVDPIESPPVKLMKYIGTLIEVPEDNPDFFVLLLNYLGQAKSHAGINKIVTRFFENIINYVDELLSAGIEGQQFNPARAKNLAQIIVAIGLGVGVMWTIDPTLFNRGEVSETAQELVHNHIG